MLTLWDANAVIVAALHWGQTLLWGWGELVNRSLSTPVCSLGQSCRKTLKYLQTSKKCWDPPDPPRWEWHLHLFLCHLEGVSFYSHFTGLQIRGVFFLFCTSEAFLGGVSVSPHCSIYDCGSFECFYGASLCLWLLLDSWRSLNSSWQFSFFVITDCSQIMCVSKCHILGVVVVVGFSHFANFCGHFTFFFFLAR